MRANEDQSPPPWWLEPMSILAHGYVGDWDCSADPAVIRRLVRAKRAMGFDAEHLILNLSMMQGAEGGDDSRAYRFRNRHGFLDDYLAAYLPEAHRRGLRVIIYFNGHWFRGTAFAEDHFILDAAGQPVTLYGSGRGVCPRGPFRPWSEAIAEDLGRYPIDGVFLDGPLQMRCFCRTCRDEFRRRHGPGMPDGLADCPQELREAYLDFPADGAAGYVEAFARGLARTNPAAILYINDQAAGHEAQVMTRTAAVTHLVGAEGGFIGYGPLDDRFPFRVGLAGRVLAARSRGRGRVVFCDGGYKGYDYYVHPRGEIARMFAGCLSAAATPWFLVLPRSLKTEGMQTALRFNRLIARRRAALRGSRSLAATAILHSPVNIRAAQAADAVARDDVGKRDTAARTVRPAHWNEFQGAYAALARSGHPFEVIEEANLLEGDLPEQLRLIVLPGVSAMSDAVAGRVREFVRGGGRVLATADTSLLDESGRPREDFALADVFGASLAGAMLGPTSIDYWTVAAGDACPIRTRQRWLACPSWWWHLRPTSAARPLLHYAEKMPRRYAGPPPASEHPAAIIHRFGRGRAILIASTVGEHYLSHGLPEHRELLAAAAAKLAPPPVRIAGAGEFVEAALRQGREGTVVLHLTNLATGRRPSTGAIPLGPLQVRLRLPRGMSPRRVETCWSPARLRFAFARGWIRFRLSLPKEYEMVIVTPA